MSVLIRHEHEAFWVMVVQMRTLTSAMNGPIGVLKSSGCRHVRG